MIPERLALEWDAAYSAGQSVVLRYAPALLRGVLSREDLLACSQKEGLRLLDLGTYRNVRLLLLDETSGMKTGTYKSLDGCIATAMCRKRGIRRVVFSSGSNTGMALTDYAGNAGMESFFFCPTGTLYKLDGKAFDRPGAHLIAVEGLDRRVKKAAGVFAEAIEAPVIPALEWRLLSGACRGLFLAEQMLQLNLSCSWFVQAVCAGFGPIGLFGALDALARAGHMAPSRIPRFMGVQQEPFPPWFAPGRGAKRRWGRPRPPGESSPSSLRSTIRTLTRPIRCFTKSCVAMAGI